jgi:hypothetical protein
MELLSFFWRGSEAHPFPLASIGAATKQQVPPLRRALRFAQGTAPVGMTRFEKLGLSRVAESYVKILQRLRSARKPKRAARPA